MRLPIAPTPAAALARLPPPRMLAGADTVVDTLLASTTTQRHATIRGGYLLACLAHVNTTRLTKCLQCLTT